MRAIRRTTMRMGGLRNHGVYIFGGVSIYPSGCGMEEKACKIVDDRCMRFASLRDFCTLCEMATQYHILEIRHSGKLIDNRDYCGGKVDFVENVDPDMISLFEMQGFLSDLGLDKDKCRMWYKPTRRDCNLILVDSDKVAFEIFNLHKELEPLVILVESLDESCTVTCVVEDERMEDADEVELQMSSDSDGDDMDDSDFSPIKDLSQDEPVNESGGDCEGRGSRCLALVEPNLSSDKGKNAANDSGMSDYDLPSDELISLSCSDGEMDGVPKYKDMDDEEISHPTLELGMKFSGPSELKQAIRQANILSGNDIKFLANKPQKV